ncbi:MAG: hypothetical protein NVS4B8_14260 [Herpetosiphon sp.]
MTVPEGHQVLPSTKVQGDLDAPGPSKPLLRGWLHAGATVGAVIVTVVFVVGTRGDWVRALSLLVFGLSMIELYGVSALYHIGRWDAERTRLLRALDHANIFVLIAGTYTPICVNVLAGRFRVTMLTLIWTLAVLGVGAAVLTLRLPRWVGTSLYLGMGWLGLATLPRLAQLLPWQALLLLGMGGLCYTVGAVIYALKRPNPLPRFFGFHEIFHLLTIGGGASFIGAIWLWVVPFPRM